MSASSKHQCDTEDIVSAMRGGARRWGEDSFLSPNMRVARTPSAHSIFKKSPRQKARMVRAEEGRGRSAGTEWRRWGQSQALLRTRMRTLRYKATSRSARPALFIQASLGNRFERNHKDAQHFEASIVRFF